MRTVHSILGAMAAAGLLLAAPQVALGQAGKKAAKKEAAKKAEPAGDGGEKKEGEGESPKVKVERGAGGKKVYVIKTGFVIEGRIQKPNAFYVLQRSQINYDWAALKQQFIPRITDAVRKSPF